MGRASFVLLMIWTLYLASHLKASGQGSFDMPLTDRPVLGLWRRRREQSRGGGGEEDVKRAAEAKVRNGGRENRGEQRWL